MAVKPLSTLRADIIAAIATNTTGAITGDILQTQMVDLLDSLKSNGRILRNDYLHVATVVASAYWPYWNGGGNYVPIIDSVASSLGGWGIGRVGVPTTVNADAYLGLGSSYMNNAIPYVHAGQMAAQRVLVPALSDATNPVYYRAGVGYGYTGLNAAAKILFSHCFTEHATNWQIISVNGGSFTTYDTGVAVVANTWYEFREIAITDTSWALYINDTYVTTITTNTPRAGFGTICYVARGATAGTATRYMWVDWQEYLP